MLLRHKPPMICLTGRPGDPVAVHQSRPFSRFAAVILLAALFLVTAAPHGDAYVPPGPLAIDRMVRSLGKGRFLQTRQQWYFFDSAASAAGGDIRETARYRFPEQFKSEIRAAAFHRLHVVSGNRSITILDKQITSRQPSRFDQYKDLLLYRSRSLMTERLTYHGVDTLVTSVGRFNDTLAIVIGARYPDESKPQVWLTKDSFLPIRWIVRPDDESDIPFEIHYSGWQKVGKQYFPRKIEFYENYVLAREIIVEQVDVTAVVEEREFSIDYYLKHYGTPDTTSPVEGESGPSEIDKTIDDFRKRFE